MWARIVASEAITNVAQSYPQYREDSVHLFGEELKKYKINDITLNAFLISGLVTLQSHDYLKEMKDAFEARCVDGMIMGGWEDVQVELVVDQFNIVWLFLSSTIRIKPFQYT